MLVSLRICDGDRLVDRLVEVEVVVYHSPIVVCLVGKFLLPQLGLPFSTNVALAPVVKPRDILSYLFALALLLRPTKID